MAAVPGGPPAKPRSWIVAFCRTSSRRAAKRARFVLGLCCQMETVEAELTTIFQVQDFLRCFLMFSSFEPKLWPSDRDEAGAAPRCRACQGLRGTYLPWLRLGHDAHAAHEPAQHAPGEGEEAGGQQQGAVASRAHRSTVLGPLYEGRSLCGVPTGPEQCRKGLECQDKGLLGRLKPQMQLFPLMARRRVATAPSQMPTATEPIFKVRCSWSLVTSRGCEVDSRVKKSITGTFEYINFRPPPAHLAWGQSSTQVPFPDLSAVVEASRCLQRPKSDSLITVQLPEPSAERKARPRGATSNICLGLHRNSYERIKL